MTNQVKNKALITHLIKVGKWPFPTNLTKQSDKIISRKIKLDKNQKVKKLPEALL